MSEVGRNLISFEKRIPGIPLRTHAPTALLVRHCHNHSFFPSFLSSFLPNYLRGGNEIMERAKCKREIKSTIHERERGQRKRAGAASSQCNQPCHFHPFLPGILSLKHESSIFTSFIQPCRWFWKCQASSPWDKQYRA